MDHKKEIINCIVNMSGKYSPYQIFSDWVTTMALAISNSVQIFHDSVWQDRESEYIGIMQKYTLEEQKKFVEMLVWLGDALEEQIEDVLGEVYMKANMGSSITGQFFTPFHVSELCARMSLPATAEEYDGKPIELNEPSCGGGGMIIAAAKVLNDAGINYQKVMNVVAQDLDWKAVYMTYVQLSLLGISAVCVQGNTLAEPLDLNKTEPGHMLYTPRKRGALL